MDPLLLPGVFSYERWSVDNSVDKTKVVESWQNKRRAYLSIIIGKLRGQVRIERFAAKKGRVAGRDVVQDGARDESKGSFITPTGRGT